MSDVAYRFEALVPRPRDAAFAWWTDFTPDDHAGNRHLRGTRSDLVHTGSTWTWTDEYVALGFRTRWRFHAELPAPDREEYEGVSAFGHLRGTITFQDADGQTRVAETGRFRPRGIGRLLLPLVRGRLIRLLEVDFREHWREYARDMMGPRSSRSSAGAEPDNSSSTRSPC